MIPYLNAILIHLQRRVRQSLYSDKYYPDWTDEDREHNRKHSCNYNDTKLHD